MAITFINFSGAAGTGAVNPGLPADITDGDILILTIEGEGEDVNADNPPPGGHWTAIDGSTGSVASATDGAADRTRNSTYWCRYDSGDPPSTAVPDAGNHTIAVITAWRGCVASGSPIHKFQSSSSSTNNTSISITGVTTTIDNCMIVVISTCGDNIGTTAYPGAQNHASNWTNASLADPSITEAVDVDSNAGSDGGIHIAYGGLAEAGDSGTTTADHTLSEEEANWCLALEPAIVDEAPTKTIEDLTGTGTDEAYVPYREVVDSGTGTEAILVPAQWLDTADTLFTDADDVWVPHVVLEEEGDQTKVITDSGSDSEDVSVPTVIGALSTDSGEGTEATPQVIQTVLLPEDTGDGEDLSYFSQAALIVYDSVEETEAQAVSTSVIVISESGTGSEEILTPGEFIYDSATGTDVILAAVSIQVEDSGEATELILTPGEEILDSATGAEEVEVASSIAVTDSGEASDLVDRLHTVLDSGEAEEETVAVSTSVVVVEDAGTFSEEILTPGEFIYEYGTGTDEIAASTDAIQIEDSASALEVILTPGEEVFDSGTGVDDILALISAIIIEDAATGLDLVSKIQTILDSATGTEEPIQVTTSTIVISDSGEGSELILTPGEYIYETAEGTDEVQSIASLVVYDSADAEDLILTPGEFIYDSAEGTEELLTTQAALIISDSADGTEDIDTSFAEAIEKEVTDSGAITEVVFLSRAIIVYDSASEDDTTSTLAELQITDSSEGTDEAVGPDVREVFDGGTLEEQLLAIASLVIADSASAADVMDSPAVKTVEDGAGGTDEIAKTTVDTKEFSVLESGAGTEAVPIAEVSLQSADSGTETTLVAMAPSLVIYDSATGDDLAEKLHLIEEVVVVTEDVFLAVVATVSDSLGGTEDVPYSQVEALVLDTASGVDSIVRLTESQKLAEDSAIGSEEILVASSVTVSDITTATEILALEKEMVSEAISPPPTREVKPLTSYEVTWPRRLRLHIYRYESDGFLETGIVGSFEVSFIPAKAEKTFETDGLLETNIVGDTEFKKVPQTVTSRRSSTGRVEQGVISRFDRRLVEKMLDATFKSSGELEGSVVGTFRRGYQTKVATDDYQLSGPSGSFEASFSSPASERDEEDMLAIIMLEAA